jgi:hypothetical protein
MESLGKHFQAIARAALARHGFAQADVVANWTAIVGEELSAISAPERIKWPRRTGEAAQKSGGTLVIRAAPGRALDLQYEASRIAGRVNGFLGYGAVSAVKVVQAAGGLPERSPPAMSKSPKSYDRQMLEMIDDEHLKAALERLGQGAGGAAAARARSSPQDK